MRAFGYTAEEPRTPSISTRNPNPRLAYTLGLVTVFFWSTVATAFKISLQHMTPLQLLFYACLTSAVTLSMVVTWQGRWHDIVEGARRHWRLSMVGGLLNPFVYYLVLFEAYDRLPAQVAQPVNYTWAIVLAVMSMVILRQPVRWHDLIAGLICYAGVFVIATHGDLTGFGNVDLVGLGLALGSTVIWASYWILVMKDVRDAIVATTLNFLVALVPVTLLLIVTSTPVAPWQGVVGAVYVGLFEMSVAFLCWSIALRHADNAARIGNLIFIAPFLSLVFIYLILGEAIYPATWAGLVLIVAGLLFQQWRARGSTN